MSRKQFVTKLKTFKISESQQEMVNSLVATGIFSTEAEIFRQGIAMINMLHNHSSEFLALMAKINTYAEVKS